MTMSAAVSSPTSVSVVSERSRLLSFSRRASRSFFSLSSYMILTRAIRCPFPSFSNKVNFLVTYSCDTVNVLVTYSCDTVPSAPSAMKLLLTDSLPRSTTSTSVVLELCGMSRMGAPASTSSRIRAERNAFSCTYSSSKSATNKQIFYNDNTRIHTPRTYGDNFQTARRVQPTCTCSCSPFCQLTRHALCREHLAAD